MARLFKISLLFSLLFVASCSWYADFKRQELVENDTINNRRYLYKTNRGSLETYKERLSLYDYHDDYGEDFESEKEEYGEVQW